MIIKNYEQALNVLDLRDAFWSIRLAPMENKNELSDDPSTDEETRARNETNRITREQAERIVTAVAVSMSTPHGNKVVPRYSQEKRREKKKTKKIYNKCTPYTQSQTDKKDKPDDGDDKQKPALSFKRMTTVKTQ